MSCGLDWAIKGGARSATKVVPIEPSERPDVRIEFFKAKSPGQVNKHSPDRLRVDAESESFQEATPAEHRGPKPASSDVRGS
jgi:hypothetical protein